VRIVMSLLSFRPGRIGGAESYVRALLRHLPEVAGGDELLAVLDRDVDRELPAPGWAKAVVPFGARALVARRILEAYTPWRDRAIERFLAGLRPDATLFPQQSIFPHRAPGPAVLTAVDVQHLLFPENFGFFDRTFRPRVYPPSMDRAAHVIAISEFTRRTLLERCGLLPERVTAVPFGVEPAPAGAAPIEPTGLVARPYLYYPAATWPHKGHATLFRSYAALRRRGDLAERLVLTGEQTRLWRRSLLPLARSLGIARDVVHLGFVPYAEVRRLYAGASAVVFPTRFEGFGLPVLEAAQQGAKLVTSRLEVFDEIGVPREAQVDFERPDELLHALRSPGPTRLLRPPLAWRDTAARTLEVLRRAA
jgi:glycosyltransferase involved in cell wall biosynthesis